MVSKGTHPHKLTQPQYNRPNKGFSSFMCVCVMVNKNLPCISTQPTALSHNSEPVASWMVGCVCVCVFTASPHSPQLTHTSEPVASWMVGCVCVCVCVCVCSLPLHTAHTHLWAGGLLDGGVCALRGPGDALHHVLVLPQLRLALFGGHHPHAHRLVVRGAGDQRAVLVRPHHAHPLSVAGERLHTVPVDRVAPYQTPSLHLTNITQGWHVTSLYKQIWII